MMSGKTSPAHIPTRSFYRESPPKRSRLQDSNNLRPAFKCFKDKVIKFDRELSEPIKSFELKEPEQQDTGEEPKSLDRDSPIPLKNLGNTCYENSIIQCLFSLNMFMNNFERSMKKMRQFVVKPKFGPKTFDARYNSVEHDSIAADETTITESDVRYRISDAFDKLYKSYTQKRIQIESINQNNRTSTNTHQDDQINGVTNFQSEFAISQSNAAIPLCKSDHEDQPITQIFADDSHTPMPVHPTITATSTTNITTDTSTSNLAPIALVSSAATPNEQSEIETRLEDLKSAVGERSSQFNSTHQQDASEFFYHVIDSIQEFYQGLDKTKDEDNPVTKAFELELDYLIKCPKCHHRTMSEPEKIRTLPLALPHVSVENSIVSKGEYTHDTTNALTPPTSDLGLDSPESNISEELRNGSDEKENQSIDEIVIPEDNSNNTMSIAKLDLTDKSEFNLHNQQSELNQQKHYTLCDALNNYFKDDLLDYQCSQSDCDSKQRTKKCLIRKLPQVLFITLARYSYTGKKNLDEIEAPFELSVPFQENKSPSHSPSAHRKFSDDNNKYQLVAVVCHLGSSLNAGHYTSYVYNQNNFSWYSCDDDSITKVQEADVKSDATKSGYCFFYAHRSYINQKQESQDQSLAQKEELKHSEETMVLTSSCLVDSSTILTPESSPKLSPSPTIISGDDEKEQKSHANHTCMRLEDIEDWS